MKEKTSLLEDILLALIPYTKENITLAFNPGKFFYQLEKKHNINKQSAYSTFYRAKKQGYLQEVEKEGQKSLSLTAKGRVKILKHLVKNKKLTWDGQWRILFFDIPEKYRKKRDILRTKLRELDFKKYQLSVWISPYDYTEEIQLLIDELMIVPYVQYLVAKAISGERELKIFFDLK